MNDLAFSIRSWSISVFSMMIFIILVLMVHPNSTGASEIPTRDSYNVPIALNSSIEIDLLEDEIGIELINLTHHFMDPDNDTLEFDVTLQRHVQAVINSTSHTVDLVPDSNWSGEDHIIIEANDGNIHNEDWPTLRINVSVEEVNDPPMIVLINDRPISIDELILVRGTQGSNEVITVGASDPDEIYGDQFSFCTNFLEMVGEEKVPVGDFTFEISTGRMSIFLSNALVGEHFFNITVKDEQGESHSAQIKLIVVNVNDNCTPPKILSPEDGTTVHQSPQGAIKFLANLVDDPDLHIPNSEERLTYHWDFGDGTDPLIYAPLEVEHRFLVSGNYTITLKVEDTYGEKREDKITILVLVNSYKPVRINVTGKLMDENGIELKGAEIFVDDELVGISGSGGYFKIQIYSGRKTLKFRYNGEESEERIMKLYEEKDQDLGNVVFHPKETERSSVIHLHQLTLIVVIFAVMLVTAVVILMMISNRKKIEE